jgi:hypothetical protein
MTWEGATRSEGRVRSYFMNGRELPGEFSIAADEPPELLGANTAPNPQNYSLRRSTPASWWVRCHYRWDGRAPDRSGNRTGGRTGSSGLLGVDANVKPGYDSIQYTVRLKGDGTKEQFEAIHENVRKTSPNYISFARPVEVKSKLVVGN